MTSNRGEKRHRLLATILLSRHKPPTAPPILFAAFVNSSLAPAEKAFRPFGAPKPNSEVRDAKAFGVLKLTLKANGYDWQFIPEEGKTFTDSGSGACH